MVSRGDQHGVDVRPLGQESIDLRIHGAVLGAVMGIHEVLDRQTLFLLQVANRDELHVPLANERVEVVHSAVLDADAPGEDFPAGRHGPVLA